MNAVRHVRSERVRALSLGLRFLLEIVALAALAYWGWAANQGVLRVALAVGLPLFAAALWGTVRVPGDPGDAPIAVSGPVRLLLEVSLLSLATLLLVLAGLWSLAAVFGLLVVVQYATSVDRIRRLWTRR